MGRLDDVLPVFEQWDFGWLDCPALIRAAEPLYVHLMVDRDPPPRWADGPVTLLGDAAHPMYPIGSNGAWQAIVDARVLAGCLHRHRHDAAVLLPEPTCGSARPAPSTWRSTTPWVWRPANAGETSWSSRWPW